MCTRFSLKVFFNIVSRTFFRSIDSFGDDNVPETGACIFVCAPHANQFLDPMIVNLTNDRQIGFLAAKKSVDRKYIGKIIKAMGSIPVMRSQDYRVKGEGTVSVSFVDGEKNVNVVGTNSNFTEQFSNGQSMYFSATKTTHRVLQVVSDTEIVLKDPVSCEIKESLYKTEPKIDQKDVYDSVWSTLNSGGCIGIFPEGGSHDRTSMLPLKAGVTIMALGALAANPDLNLKVIPCGLNYFKAHKFRSRAAVQYGEPFEVPKDLVELYASGGPNKRKACGALLELIEDRLRLVTVNVEDHELLRLIQMTRKLYNPGVHLDTDQKLALVQRFGMAYQMAASDTDLQEVRHDIQEYIDALKYYGLKDFQVAKRRNNWCWAFWLLWWRILKLLVMFSLAIPGLVLFAPMGLVAEHISAKKAKEAKANSTVKVAGKDVLATWKVMVGAVLYPLLCFLYAIVGLLIAVFVVDDLDAWIIALVPVACFFVLFPSGYATVRYLETGIQIAQSIRPLVWAVIPCCKPRTLMQQRKDVQKKIVRLVETKGPEIFADGDEEKFNRERIVPRHEFRDFSIVRNQPDLGQSTDALINVDDSDAQEKKSDV